MVGTQGADFEPEGETGSGMLKDFLIFLGLVLVGLVIAAIALPVLRFVLAAVAALATLLVLALIVYLVVYCVSPETAVRWRQAIERAFR